MPTIVPQPKKITSAGGTFYWSSSTPVYLHPEFAGILPLMKEILNQTAAYLPAETAEAASVCFEQNGSLSPEGYRLHVTSQKITAEASTSTGALYAFQSLRQWAGMDTLPGGNGFSVAGVEIEDEPRFSWRGQMLDCSRHFWPLEEIKRLLDLMSFHKLNIFHWHLTDDQGWRIEIKKHPLLTEIGSKRKDSQINGWKTKKIQMEGKPCEGYYTQEQIREIVEYAQIRGITIIPEVDMPAHLAAAEAAYPWLACRELPTEVLWYYNNIIPRTQLGIQDGSWNRPACLGKESTYQFIFDVLDEVCDLFPAPYFHIGGDEAPRDEWKKCPHCQKAIQENNLANVDELQGHFNNRVREYVKKKGKRLIGWNEILNAKNLDASVIGQYWVPWRDKHAEQYINERDGQMILSRQPGFYFDYPNAWYPLKKTYTFEPTKSGIRPEKEKNVLGIEGELWTEFVPDREKLDVCLFPRMGALAETAWSPKETRNFSNFCQRLPEYQKELEALGVNYARDALTIHSTPLRFLQNWHAFLHQDPCIEVKQNRALKRQEKESQNK